MFSTFEQGPFFLSCYRVAIQPDLPRASRVRCFGGLVALRGPTNREQVIEEVGDHAALPKGFPTSAANRPPQGKQGRSNLLFDRQ
jgi:hypothetical protein